MNRTADKQRCEKQDMILMDGNSNELHWNFFEKHYVCWVYVYTISSPISPFAILNKADCLSFFHSEKSNFFSLEFFAHYYIVT